MTKEEFIVKLNDKLWEEYDLEEWNDIRLVAVLEMVVDECVNLGMLPAPHYVSILTREPHPRGEMILYDWEKVDE